jgi:ABC-2 type transport system permease protein
MRQYRKSAVAWVITYAVLLPLVMSAMPMFVEESGAIKDMLSKLPEAVLASLEINPDLFTGSVGYFSYVFLYIGLTAAVQALNLGLSVISKENRMKTVDFLLSKPVPRAFIYLQKLSAALAVLFISQVSFYIAAVVSVSIQSPDGFDFKTFALIALTFTFIQLFFLCLGMFLAVLFDRIKSAVSLTMGVAFGVFFIGMVSSIADSEALRYLSPLRYFDNGYIIANGAYETRFLALAWILTLLFAAAGFVVFIKKDVRAAV